jgi:hypothetical protein
MPRSKKVELYLYSPIPLHGVRHRGKFTFDSRKVIAFHYIEFSNVERNFQKVVALLNVIVQCLVTKL